MIYFAKLSIILGLGLLLLVLFILRLRMRNGIRIPMGITAIAFFSASYLFFDQLTPITNILGPANAIEAQQAIATLFWLAVAYTCNVFIKRFGYQRRLTAEGDPKVPIIIQYLVTFLVYSIAVMIIVRVVYDQPIFAIAATSGALAIVLGYSARTVLEEIFAGIAINFSSPFEKGDLVQLNDEWALIKDIDWRSITYLDMDNNNVVVPNSVVAASKIRNLDRPDGVTRRIFYFLVEYNIPPKVVIDLGMAAMKECPHVVDHEWNDVALFDFDDTGIKYRVAFHINNYNDWWVASNEFFNTLWYSFKRAGVRWGQQRHLNYANHENAERGLPTSALEDANWQALVERFNHAPMFEGMTNEDMEELAKCATLHVVGPPERIIRAGSQRSAMYLIAAGEADVFEVDQNGKETWMGEVAEGETVGLMALLTGEPQHTTIRARTESAVWEIDSESLHAVFERKPEVMDNIAEAVVRWQAEETDALNAIQMSRLQEEKMIDKNASSLSKRIARFFDRDKKGENGEGYTNY